MGARLPLFVYKQHYIMEQLIKELLQRIEALEKRVEKN